jgi:uncharacterized protein YjcR
MVIINKNKGLVMAKKINIATSVDDERVINDKIIEDAIFDEQLVDYRFEEREESINDLIQWASETKSENDRFLMKEDLKQLLNLSEKYVLSSVTTNEYLSQEDDEERFREVCLEILEANTAYLKENGLKQRETRDLSKPQTI